MHSVPNVLTRIVVCHLPDSLQDETDQRLTIYLNNVFSKNNFNTHSNTNSNTQTNINSGPVMTATIPYIRGMFTINNIIATTCICILHTNQ